MTNGETGGSGFWAGSSGAGQRGVRLVERMLELNRQRHGGTGVSPGFCERARLQSCHEHRPSA
jgi:hypothetical protein